MPLQLDIEPVWEGPGQFLQKRLGRGLTSGLEVLADGPVRPAGQADKTFSMGLQLLPRHLRQIPPFAQIEAGVELEEVPVARLVLRQKHHGRRYGRALAGLGPLMGQRHLTADDGLNTRPDCADRELECREHVVRIRHRNRRHARVATQVRELLQADRAFEKRVFGMGAEMDESGGAAHAGHSMWCAPPRKRRLVSQAENYIDRQADFRILAI